MCNIRVRINSKLINCKITMVGFFFGGQDSNPKPCIYYALFIPAELSSRGLTMVGLIEYQAFLELLSC